MANIPRLVISGVPYDIKDTTAREHLVEVGTTQPVSPDNKLWFRNHEEEYEVPVLSDLVSSFSPLKDYVAGEYISNEAKIWKFTQPHLGLWNLTHVETAHPLDDLAYALRTISELQAQIESLQTQIEALQTQTDSLQEE